MQDPWLEKWNERYSKAEYAYGEAPNVYLKEQLEKLPVGKILFPAEGEGRNAVFAATLGWDVAAFDMSSAGKQKALDLANKYEATINYQVGTLDTLSYPAAHFDAIALIYAHFPATLKSGYHRILESFLRPGGTLIFEAFSKTHLDYRSKNPRVGGPRDLATLFSVEEIEADFPNYDRIELVETEVELSEGRFHNGRASVIRFVGKKPE